MTDVPPIQFADARGARLAYQMWGEGPATIVAIPPLAQNIEVAWEWPTIRRMFDRFGGFSRFLHFDKRGTGSSDRRSRVPGIDERVDDIRAVMDAADVESGHFFVQSDGGPMALLFAATYPERVESLTLVGSFAAREFPGTPEEYVHRRDRAAAEWGTPDSTIVDRFAPSMAADQEYRTWHQRYERQSATTDSMRELLDLTFEMDVTEILGDLDVPTLVIHRTGDRAVPVELGRDLADRIPGARLLELPGDDHFSYAGDLESWMTEVERFVTGTVRPRPEPTPRSAVRIRTLGGFAVERDGAEVPVSAWGSRIARQVCKRLVAARGWPVTRDELIDLLWPDEADRARLGARLSVQLSHLRRVLGGGVVADRETVRLDLDEVDTDLEIFFAASDDAAVVASHPGPFLPEDVYDDWTGPTRDEVRTRFVAAARALANAAATRGDHVEAVQLGRRLVAEDRWDEDAHRLIVDTLVRAGEVGEARRSHEAYADAMAELDVEVPPFRS
ncbi:MAG: alpha/beta fold hydrolase [Acidimicrobiia bacterium]|nr:alpha/beta fold hydrolase [Acidimicrobiia bacterium]